MLPAGTRCPASAAASSQQGPRRDQLSTAWPSAHPVLCDTGLVDDLAVAL
jgi:hypothetical protein